MSTAHKTRLFNVVFQDLPHVRSLAGPAQEPLQEPDGTPAPHVANIEPSQAVENPSLS